MYKGAQDFRENYFPTLKMPASSWGKTLFFLLPLVFVYPSWAHQNPLAGTSGDGLLPTARHLAQPLPNLGVQQASVSKGLQPTPCASAVLIDLIQCNVCNTTASTHTFQQSCLIKPKNTNCSG